MPKRFNPKERYWIYLYLVKRDGGDYCRLCGKPAETPFSLDIDHIDNNSKNDDPDNLQLAHRKCNQKKEIAYRKNRKAKVVNVSVEGSAATRMIKDVIDYKAGSAEMQANGMFEMPYRKWVITQIADNGFIEKKHAIYTGAEIVGCSPTTTQRYTEKLLSAAGALQEQKDALGNKILIFKDDIYAGLEAISRAKEAKKKAKDKTRPGAPESRDKE